jgi:hypothetical protein
LGYFFTKKKLRIEFDEERVGLLLGAICFLKIKTYGHPVPKLRLQPYVTLPLSNSPSGGFAPQLHPMQSAASVYGEADLPTSDSMAAGLGGLAAKGDFDRRKKKR